MKRHDRKRNVFRGEREGRFLVEWLDDSANAASRERILAILYDVRKVAGHGKRKSEGVFQLADERGIIGVVVELNERLAKYKGVVPAVQHLGSDYWIFGYRYLPPRCPANKKGIFDVFTASPAVPAVVSEFMAVQGIFALANAWLLDRLRQCDSCKKWMYARFPHTRFCSNKCRIEHWRTNEEYKARKRENSKKNYLDRKERERRGLERVEREHRQRKGKRG
jgi:hypothetical protein